MSEQSKNKLAEDAYTETVEHPEPEAPPRQTREKIATDTLARYSNSEPFEFQPYILISNFPQYVNRFVEEYDAVLHQGPVIKVAHSEKLQISVIDFRVGAPMAALLIDVLSYIVPQCVVITGLCGGLHRTQKVGDFFLPVAAIRDEGVSRHYIKPLVPSLPSFMVQKYIADELLSQNLLYRTGVIHTTDYRMWEFDEKFCSNLKEEKASAIDMECSAVFSVGFTSKIPVGALMLVSDLPLQPGGVKTRDSAKDILANHTKYHLHCAVKSLLRMKKAKENDEIHLRKFIF